jgi:hypothetical protein
VCQNFEQEMQIVVQQGRNENLGYSCRGVLFNRACVRACVRVCVCGGGLYQAGHTVHRFQMLVNTDPVTLTDIR